MRLLLAAVLSCTLLAAPALAQQHQRVIYPSKTIIDLDGQVIDGVVEGPRMTSIFVRKRTRFGNAIQLRQSFRGELLGSAADL